MIQTDVAVIGGGAAGLTAAITAARYGAKTVLIEHMDRVGKKLLSTGNGKCNYTNALQGVSCYRGEDPAFVLPVFAQFGFEETIRFFEELGVYPKVRNGYYYPASEQASSVLDVLRMECGFQNVHTYTSCTVSEIKTGKNGYLIHTDKGAFSTRTAIFATGLLAAPKTGSDGSAFPYIEGLGHHFIDIVPALVGLKAKQSFFKTIAGIRAESTIYLYAKNRHIRPNGNGREQCTDAHVLLGSEHGELQLTAYGISGIPVFQLSRFATRALKNGQEVFVLIDFMPQLAPEALLALLKQRFYDNAHGKDAAEALVGLFNKKLIDVLLKESGIGLHLPASEVGTDRLFALCGRIKQFRADITGSKGTEDGQVCAGGVDTAEIGAETLESKLSEGIYFAGEVIDIDGICGGYNLQWAWSSGYVAGMHAAEKGTGKNT